MKKVILSAAVLMVVGFVSCGESETSESSSNQEVSVDTPNVNEVENFKPFTKEGLEGSWTVTDGSGYSKDKFMGKTYVFNGDTATVYGSYGDGGMVSGYYEILDDLVSIQIKYPSDDGSTVTMFIEYTGGLTENGVQLNSNSEKITLSK